MWIATAILITFVIAIVEVPFSLFINISVERALVEYMLSFPIKANSYAYLKNGEIVSGSSRGDGKIPLDVSEVIKQVGKRVIIKSLHIRSVISGAEIEQTMLRSVLFSSVASGVLNFAHQNNSDASLSQSYHISGEDDNNIFVETVFWLSVFDVLSTAILAIIKNIQTKKEK